MPNNWTHFLPHLKGLVLSDSYDEVTRVHPLNTHVHPNDNDDGDDDDDDDDDAGMNEKDRKNPLIEIDGSFLRS